jgi:hypothetical protein
MLGSPVGCTCVHGFELLETKEFTVLRDKLPSQSGVWANLEVHIGALLSMSVRESWFL